VSNHGRSVEGKFAPIKAASAPGETPQVTWRRLCTPPGRQTRRLAAFFVVVALVGASQAASAQSTTDRPARRARAEHGLPRPAKPIAIPQQFAPQQEDYASFPQKTAVTPISPSACQMRLTKTAVFRALPVLVGPGECGADDAVLLEAVILPDQTKVTVTPPATLRCTMAEAIADWVRDDIAPAAMQLGAPLRGLDNFDSYECRGRNRVRGATLSEHGRANALDVRAFRLANGEEVVLTDVTVAKDWREAIRASACARFATVLGPGSDGAHEAHIHVDLAPRHNNYKICEWDVREPVVQTAGPAPLPPDTVPLPRPRPVIHAAAPRRADQ
jgi:hypothetical protein